MKYIIIYKLEFIYGLLVISWDSVGYLGEVLR